MIYADYNGSAPICADVKEYLIHRLESGQFANPNAIHHLGQRMMLGMENARAVCAKNLGTLPKNIIFNSGSTEGISQIFYSVLSEKKKENKNVIIISGIEHSAVKKTAEHYCEESGFKLFVIPTLKNGLIDVGGLKFLVNQHTDNVALVAAMAANNETGVIQPYEQIAKICNEANIKFFSDTTQLIGKAPFNFDESGIDYAVMSGHKLGALTGTGLVLAKDTRSLKPLIIGGGQERNLRGGTQNYLGYETLAVALEYFKSNLSKIEALQTKREEFEQKLKKRFQEIVIIGEGAPRLASTTYVSYPGIHGQAVQIELEEQKIFVTTSSACSDNEPTTSKVLMAMGIDDKVGRGVVRISLGLCSPLEWYDKIYHAIENAYIKLGKLDSIRPIEA